MMTYLRYFILVIPFLFDTAFIELVTTDLDLQGEIYASFIRPYIMLTVLISFIFFYKLNRFLRFWFLVSFALILTYIFQSLYSYSNFFIYPHVFLKILSVCLVYFAYLYAKFISLDNLKIISILIIAGIFLNLLLVNPDSFSLSAFMENERGLVQSSTYLLLIPCLYYFNNFLFTKKNLFLYIFLVLIGLIVFLQQRTVWVSLFFALFVNIVILIRNKRISYNSIMKLTMVFVAIAVILSLTILSNEKISSRIEQHIEEIVNPISSEESTSGWRYLQYQSYWPFIERNFFFGMRFKGFELPIQFYNPDTDAPVFDDGTGHHIHSFYVDQLFYNGLIGLTMYLVLLFYVIVLFFKQKRIDINNLTVGIFTVSGLVYGISYDWPYFFYYVIGLCIWFLSRDDYLLEVKADQSMS